MSIETPDVDWLALSPTVALLAAAGVALLGAVLAPRVIRPIFCGSVTTIGFLASGLLAVAVFDRTPDPTVLLADSMTRDRYAAFAQIVIAGSGALATLLALDRRRADHAGEFFALLAVAGAGMAFVVGADSLMTIFLGIEWFSITLYILCAMDTHRRASLEAGLKYLIVGSFGTAILLFGSALVYGATGELGLPAIASATGVDEPLLVAGLAMILAGLAFKISAAPFHMWTPDVYQGSPTSITAFMSAATKVAASVVLLRVLTTAFPEWSGIWTVAVAVLACASLAVGNFAALVQQDVKRLLAYSSISHAGFLLIAVSANSELGASALLYYLVPYAAMSVGALGVVTLRELEIGRPVQIADLQGLGWERPWMGASMWVFMLGFAGFPLTGGLIGKLYVFAAAYEAGWWWLVVVGVAATALSLYYYLGVVRALYMRGPSVTAASVAAGASPPTVYPIQAAVLVSLAVTVGSFFFAGPIADAARKAAEQLF